MRTITDHAVNPANEKLTITVMDNPGHGGANHFYIVSGFDIKKNPTVIGLGGVTDGPDRGLPILFQNGPIAEAGANGLTHEVLLAILADRLRGFQSGQYACEANATALEHIEAAQAALKARTLERMNRGVEGTHAV